MIRMVNCQLRTILILAAVLLFSTCEFLFYSPAFMPAVSETVVKVNRSTNFLEEWFNDEYSAGWSVNTTGMPLQITNTSTSGNSVPAMAALWENHQLDPWYGIVEYLGLFFSAGGIDLIVEGGFSDGPSSNHFGESFTFDYVVSLLPSYDLPFPAVKGIDGGGYQDTIGYAVSVVGVRTTSLTADSLEGEGTFIFSNLPEHNGLLYGVYEHTGIGLTTLFYRNKQSTTDGESYFPSGKFTYIINVFQR